MAQRTNEQQRPTRIGLISLGCAKNLVDAEIIVGSLMKSGLEITNDPASADVVIINTCSFIDAAQEESVDAILESEELRAAKNRGQALIVSGCLPQRFRNELPRLLPEVDAFMGIDQITEVSAIVAAALQHRSERLLGAQNARAGKQQISRALAGIEAKSPLSPDNDSTSLRGTATFGRTKTIITSGVISGKTTPQNPTPPLMEVNQRPKFIQDFATPRFRLTPRHFAYVKIADGCNHPCSFCVIPRIRGAHRSRTQADVVAEARELIASGVKELNLISQDSTYYGLDLQAQRRGATAALSARAKPANHIHAKHTTLCSLIRELNSLQGDFWIRLLYTHPAHWTDELIEAIAECRKVARYIDVPLQHIHDDMLQRMRRETSQQQITSLIRRIRGGIPGIAIRTAFIVGFPGETSKHFDALVDFMREMQFERVGIFTYSQQEGTVAGRMSGQVSDVVKQKRRERAMAEQLKIARRISASFVDREIKVLVEGRAALRELRQANVTSWEHALLRSGSSPTRTRSIKTASIARSEADAPDIDGKVYVRGRLAPGEFARIRIIGHTDYDLIAEPT